MIDPRTESLVSFPDAPNSIPGKPHISTLHRWRLKGVRGRRLETIVRGGRRFTSIEAINRFMHSEEVPGSPARAPADRANEAGRELDDLGV
jgi:hypothetical protein